MTIDSAHKYGVCLSVLSDRASRAMAYVGMTRGGDQNHLRALVMEPAVLLLDEPFRGMDAISRCAMHDALLEIFDKSAVTVLFITHDIEEVVYLGSRVTVMTTHPGRVKTTVDISLDHPRDPQVRYRTALLRTR